jgi:cell division septation protein DedD
MFFGKVINKASPFTFSEEHVDETAGDVLSITNVTLAPGSGNQASLYIKKGDQEFLVVSLTKDKPQATVNLFIALIDEVTLVVKGDATIHFIGFFEPEQDGDFPLGDEEEDDEEEDEEEDNEESEEEEVEAPKAVAPKAAAPVAAPAPKAAQPKVASPKTQPAAKPQAVKAQPAKAPAVVADEEDEEDEDDEDLEDLEDI